MYRMIPAVITLATICGAAAGSPPLLDGNVPVGSRDIVWLYDSPLTVYEEIIDLGGDLYGYTYSFENVDEKHLWHFAVYTTFQVEAVTATWDAHPEWVTAVIDNLDGVFPVYDARNLDPDIVALNGTYALTYPDITDPIFPGETVQGFAFMADTYDNSAKYYFYETVEDGYAGDTGYVAAVGLTTPYVAVEAQAWSDVKAMYR
jgi:hypothetical protein